MIELQDSFQGKAEVSDYTFKRVVSNSTGYVFEISDANNNRHYETFKRKTSKKHVSHLAGKEVTFEAKVKYPSSNDFGLWAWCLKDYSSAMACYARLNEESQENMEFVESDNTDVAQTPGVYKQLAFEYW